MAICLRHVPRVVTGFDVRFYADCATHRVLIGRIHNEPGRLTAVRFR